MKERTPWWFTLLLVVTALPMFCMLDRAGFVLEAAYGIGETRIVGWLYPVYVVASGLCAWFCYPSRRTVAWILEAMMALMAVLLYLC